MSLYTVFLCTEYLFDNSDRVTFSELIIKSNISIRLSKVDNLPVIAVTPPSEIHCST